MRAERIVAAVVLSMAAGCATYNLPVEGVVVDAADGNKPIPNAFVIAAWIRHGSDPVGSRTTCPRMEVVQADSRGRFSIPASDVGLSTEIDRVIYAYKKGYETQSVSEYGQRIVSMMPFRGTDNERAVSFREYGFLRQCGSADQVIGILRPLYVEIDKELADLHQRGPIQLPPGAYVRMLEDLQETMEIERKFEREQQIKGK